MKALQLYSLNQIRDKYGDEKLQEIIDNFGLENVKRKIDGVKAEIEKKFENFVKLELKASNDMTDDERIASHFILNQVINFLVFLATILKSFGFQINPTHVIQRLYNFFWLHP